MNNFNEAPSGEQVEAEKEYRPEIRLEIFRHDRAGAAGEGMTDEQRRLTPEGREKASERGAERQPDPQMGFAYGSPRERSQETALRQLLANEAIVTDESTLEDLRGSLEKAMPYGNKLVVTDKLDYMPKNSDPAFAAEFGKNYSEGKLLTFMLNDSDALVEKIKSPEDYSYSRIAGHVAQIVKRYTDIMPTWERIYNEKKYGSQNEMQRFIGTHQGITELFVMKVIEKMEGHEAAEKFIEALPDKNGGAFSEGATVTIQMENEKPKITIKCGGREFSIGEDVLDSILNDEASLDETVHASLKESKPDDHHEAAAQ